MLDVGPYMKALEVPCLGPPDPLPVSGPSGDVLVSPEKMGAHAQRLYVFLKPMPCLRLQAQPFASPLSLAPQLRWSSPCSLLPLPLSRPPAPRTPWPLPCWPSRHALRLSSGFLAP